jgi:predicted transcriptional regulator
MTPKRARGPSLPTPFRGPLQWAVLKALMGGQTMTARQIEKAINAGRPRRLAYTTVRTALERLVDRGAVRRERSGSVFLYRSVAREADMVDELVDAVIEGLAGFGPGALRVLQERLDTRVREDQVAS